VTKLKRTSVFWISSPKRTSVFCHKAARFFLWHK